MQNDDSDDTDETVEADLTHFGRLLSEVENFKDPVISDSDEDSDSGRISGQFNFLLCKKSCVILIHLVFLTVFC